MEWKSLKKIAEGAGLITPEVEGSGVKKANIEDELDNALAEAAKMQQELHQLGKPAVPNRSTQKIINVPPDQELEEALMKKVFNEAVAGKYITFIGTVNDNKAMGDPDEKSYVRSFMLMKRIGVMPDALEQSLQAILQALEKEREIKIAEQDRIKTETVDGLTLTIQQIDAEQAAIAKKLEEEERIANEKIKAIQDALKISTAANRDRQEKIRQKKIESETLRETAENELALRVAAEEAAFNVVNQNFLEQLRALRSFKTQG